VLLLVAALAALDAGALGWWLSWLAFLSWLSCVAVTAAKGKWGIVAVDGFIWLLFYVAAFRLAKPRSRWARTFYDREKMHRARLRYGGRPSEVECDEIGA
jgi:hypothetical protein